jgi:hypothetical protein
MMAISRILIQNKYSSSAFEQRGIYVNVEKIVILLQQTTSLVVELNLSENSLRDASVISLVQALH